MYKTGATGGNVQTPGDIRIPTLQIPDLSIDWGKMKQGFELGRRMATAKKDREDELAMNAAKIKAAEASADSDALKLKEAEDTYTNRVKAINEDATLNATVKARLVEQEKQNYDNYLSAAKSAAEAEAILKRGAAERAPTEAATAASKATQENIAQTGATSREPENQGVLATKQALAGETSSRQLDAVRGLPSGVLSDANVTISGDSVVPTKQHLPLKPTVVGFEVQKLKDENGNPVLSHSGRPLSVKVLKHSDGTSIPEGAPFESGGAGALDTDRGEILGKSPIGYLSDLSPSYDADPVTYRNQKKADDKRTNDLNEAVKKAERAASAARRFMSINAKEDTGGIQGNIQKGRTYLQSANTKELNSLSATMGVESVVRGQGSVSNQERDLYARRQPNTSNERSVNDNLAKGIISIADREKEHQKFLAEWNKLGIGPTAGAEVWWQEYIDSNPAIYEDKSGNIVLNEERPTWQEYFESRNPNARPGEAESREKPVQEDAKHKQAVEWALAHPNDPRSKQILALRK